MSRVEWYYARDNVQMGPVSSVELKRLASTGELGPEHLVWREGMTDWSLARNVRGLFEEEEKPPVVVPPQATDTEASQAPEPVAAPAIAAETTKASGESAWRHPWEIVLDRLRPLYNGRRLDSIAWGCQRLGAYLLLVAMAAEMTLAVLAAIKASPVSSVLHGLAMVLVLAAVQYAASKFCQALPLRNRTVSGFLSSSLLPQCLAVVSVLASLAVLLGGIATFLLASDYFSLAAGVAGFILLAYMALVALRYDELNLVVDEGVALAEECFGIFLFLVKLTVRLAPMVFGVGVVLGTGLLGFACYLAFRGADPLGTAMLSAIGMAACIYASLFPLATYLGLLLVSLLTAIGRALLSMPVQGNHSVRAAEEPPARETLGRAG